MQRLLDFDVGIESSRDGYRTHVVASPAGEAYADLVLPFSDADIENFVLKVGMWVGRGRRKTRRIESPERRQLQTFGRQLYEAVFSGAIRECLTSSQQVADSKSAGLRLRLRLPGELTNIPWEYLHNGAQFICLSSRTALVRYVEMPFPVRPFPISPPLRILAMISAPSDIPRLQDEDEWVKLNNALAGLRGRGMVQVDRLPTGTLAGLQRQLQQGGYHVLHFIGHGIWDEDAQDGAIAVEDDDYKTRLVTGRDLWVMLDGCRSLRMVVLNACEGARSARDDPFGGVAQALVRQGIPAVIAMQFEISDPAAVLFSQSFYQAIADGVPVDLAVARARIAMFAKGNEVEWATPVLYLRSPDGRVFTRGRVSVADESDQEEAARKAQDEAARKAVTPQAKLREFISSRRHLMVRILGGIVLVIALIAAGIIFVRLNSHTARQHTSNRMLSFKDEFSSTANGWTVNGQDASGEYANSRYLISLKAAKDSYGFATSHALDLNPPPSSIAIEVTARPIFGAANLIYGIACRAEITGATDYEFTIEQGYAQIVKYDYENENGNVLASGALPASSVNGGYQLRAVCSSDGGKNSVRLMFSVNGVPLADVVDRTNPIETGTIGLVAERVPGTKDAAEAEFGDLAVTQIRVPS